MKFIKILLDHKDLTFKFVFWCATYCQSNVICTNFIRKSKLMWSRDHKYNNYNKALEKLNFVNVLKKKH